MTVDKSLLMKARLPEADVEVPGVGTVRVRGLSRAEAMQVQKLGDSDIDVLERKLLALALVEPELTEDEVERWQAASTAGELEPVTNRVMELSGITATAAKEAYKEFDEDPDAEFQLPPGG